MDIFFIKLKKTLNKVLIWSEKFLNGERDYDFDIDDELYNLSKEYNIDFKQGNLLLIYNLLDFYCDAVKHGFKKIDNNYSILDAQVDIKTVISSLSETGNNLEFTNDLKKRLMSI